MNAKRIIHEGYVSAARSQLVRLAAFCLLTAAAAAISMYYVNSRRYALLRGLQALGLSVQASAPATLDGTIFVALCGLALFAAGGLMWIFFSSRGFAGLAALQVRLCEVEELVNRSRSEMIQFELGTRDRFPGLRQRQAKALSLAYAIMKAMEYKLYSACAALEEEPLSVSRAAAVLNARVHVEADWFASDYDSAARRTLLKDATMFECAKLLGGILQSADRNLNEAAVQRMH